MGLDILSHWTVHRAEAIFLRRYHLHDLMASGD
jgi:hypothetical protein